MDRLAILVNVGGSVDTFDFVLAAIKRLVCDVLLGQSIDLDLR